MKNRNITLHDGSTLRINDNDWRSVANCKVFDADSTEIIRVTRCVAGPIGLVRVYAMRGENSKKVFESNRVVLPGGDIKLAVNMAVKEGGLGTDVAKQALAAL